MRPYLQSRFKIDLDEFQQSSPTLSDLDDAITCKLWGYNDKSEYYDKTSCIHRLNDVKIPLLFFRACDDPVVDQHDDPGQFFKDNKNVLLATT